MSDKTVFISVYEKRGIVEIAAILEQLGYEIYAYGSSVKELKKKNIDVYELVDKSGMHLAVIEAIKRGHYVNGNFSFKRPDIIIADLPEVDMLDENNLFIGKDNANLIRFAAEYYEDIVIISQLSDCIDILDRVKIFGQNIPVETKRYYASKALNLLAYNEAKISRALFENILLSDNKIVLPLKKLFSFKYGENSHQDAAFYILPSQNITGMSAIRIIKGSSFNLNHYLDLNLANELLSGVSEPACIISKHGNVVGFAVSDKIVSAFDKVIKSDRLGSFSAICAFNRIVDEDTAAKISRECIECISAPDYQKASLEILKKKADLRLVKIPLFISQAGTLEFFNLNNGFAVQEKDDTDIMNRYKVVTQKEPSFDEIRALRYAALVAKYCKTYSAILFSENVTYSISGPQPSVYDAIKVLIEKFKYKNSFIKNQKFILAVNGALNFKSISELSGFNISSIIQPGNSSEDEECIEFCNRKNISMIFTYLRHFRH